MRVRLVAACALADLCLAPTAGAAAPRIIMVTGPSLDEPVFKTGETGVAHRWVGSTPTPLRSEIACISPIRGGLRRLPRQRNVNLVLDLVPVCAHLSASHRVSAGRSGADARVADGWPLQNPPRGDRARSETPLAEGRLGL